MNRPSRWEGELLAAVLLAVYLAVAVWASWMLVQAISLIL